MPRLLLCLGLLCLAGCSKGTNIHSSFSLEHGSTKAIFLEPAAQERTIVASWSGGEGGLDGYIVTAANENEAIKGMDESPRPDKKIILQGMEMKGKDSHEFTFTAKANQGYALVLHRDINAKGPKTVKVTAEMKTKQGG
jgi:hypothetical protein